MPPLENFNDEDLMLRFRDTLDERVFDELTERYYGRALTIAESRIFDRVLARDAVQDTFVRIVRNRKKYDGRSFATWFYTILRNTCTDFIRKEMRHRRKLETLAAQPRPDAPAPEQSKFEEITAGLPPAERELMVYRYVQGLSFAEIAELLGCTEDAAKKRGQRALKKLRKRFVPPENDSAY